MNRFYTTIIILILTVPIFSCTSQPVFVDPVCVPIAAPPEWIILKKEETAPLSDKVFMKLKDRFIQEECYTEKLISQILLMCPGLERPKQRVKRPFTCRNPPQ